MSNYISIKWDRYLAASREESDNCHSKKLLLELEACPGASTDPVTVREFKLALDIAISEPAVQKEKIEALKASREGVEKLENIMAVVGVIGAIPALVASGGMALGAGLVAVLASAWRKKQEKDTDKGVDELLALLCVDEDLLSIVDNDIETEYWANEDDGLRAEVEAFIARADDNEPMPNFTKHFLNWINTKSKYAADSPATPNTKIVEK
tara:strand:+ start:267 stop:896 length:630 start_codon:yes stop_codon:yes gene_type:complete